MTRSENHFSEFGPHTLLKHAILRAYVERWARILLARRNSTRSVVRFVDACAGTGGDRAGNPGSPLIALGEAIRATDQLTAIRDTPVRVEVVAIEKERKHVERLRRLLSSDASGLSQIWEGTLESHMSRLQPSFRTIPTLFFIDPFGLAPLRADVVAQALQGPHNELLLLFADQAALRHIGVARVLDDELPVQESLFGDDESKFSRARPSGVEATAEAAIRILNTAFGDDRWRRVNDLPQADRRQALVDLYAEMLRGMGAKHVLPLPIIDNRRRFKYHLMYATKAGKGYETFKDAVERGWRGGLVDERAVQLMQLGASARPRQVAHEIRNHFAGKTISWTGKTPETSVRVFALQKTSIMPHQLESLKTELREWRVGGKKIIYNFGSITRS